MAENPEFQKVAKIKNIAALSPEQRKKYDPIIKAFRDTLAVYEGSYLSGYEKGYKEGYKKVQNGRMLKEAGVSTEIIQEITGLTAEEIAQL